MLEAALNRFTFSFPSIDLGKLWSRLVSITEPHRSLTPAEAHKRSASVHMGSVKPEKMPLGRTLPSQDDKRIIFIPIDELNGTLKLGEIKYISASIAEGIKHISDSDIKDVNTPVSAKDKTWANQIYGHAENHLNLTTPEVR